MNTITLDQKSGFRLDFAGCLPVCRLKRCLPVAGKLANWTFHNIEISSAGQRVCQFATSICFCSVCLFASSSIEEATGKANYSSDGVVL